MNRNNSLRVFHFDSDIQEMSNKYILRWIYLFITFILLFIQEGYAEKMKKSGKMKRPGTAGKAFVSTDALRQTGKQVVKGVKRKKLEKQEKDSENIKKSKSGFDFSAIQQAAGGLGSEGFITKMADTAAAGAKQQVTDALQAGALEKITDTLSGLTGAVAKVQEQFLEAEEGEEEAPKESAPEVPIPEVPVPMAFTKDTSQSDTESELDRKPTEGKVKSDQEQEGNFDLFSPGAIQYPNKPQQESSSSAPSETFAGFIQKEPGTISPSPSPQPYKQLQKQQRFKSKKKKNRYAEFVSIYTRFGPYAPEIYPENLIVDQEATKIKSIFDEGIEKCSMSNIIYVLLQHRPFTRPESSDLKNYLIGSLVKGLNGSKGDADADKCFYFSFKNLIENDVFFNDIALMLLYGAANHADPILQSLVFTETFRFSPKDQYFIHKILAQRNLTLYQVLQTFLSSVYNKDSCQIEDILKVLRSLSKQEIVDYLYYIFPKETQKKYPEFLYKVAEIPEFKATELKDLIDFTAKKEPSPDKTMQCYR